MDFQTNYAKKEYAPVPMSKELITEQTGYRTTKEIVEGMVLAGQRLSDYRHGMLDNFDEEYDESQEANEVYMDDPVDIQNAVERNVMRFRGEKKEVSDEPSNEGVKGDSKDSNTSVAPETKQEAM